MKGTSLAALEPQLVEGQDEDTEERRELLMDGELQEPKDVVLLDNLSAYLWYLVIPVGTEYRTEPILVLVFTNGKGDAIFDDVLVICVNSVLVTDGGRLCVYRVRRRSKAGVRVGV